MVTCTCTLSTAEGRPTPSVAILPSPSVFSLVTLWKSCTHAVFSCFAAPHDNNNLGLPRCGLLTHPLRHKGDERKPLGIVLLWACIRGNSGYAVNILPVNILQWLRNSNNQLWDCVCTYVKVSYSDAFRMNGCWELHNTTSRRPTPLIFSTVPGDLFEEIQSPVSTAFGITCFGLEGLQGWFAGGDSPSQ